MPTTTTERVDLTRQARNAKILSILQLFFFGGPFAIPAVVHSIKAENRIYDGLYEEGRYHLRSARSWQVIAAIAGGLFVAFMSPWPGL